MKASFFFFSLCLCFSLFAVEEDYISMNCSVIDPCQHADSNAFPVCFESLLVGEERVRVTRKGFGQNGGKMEPLTFEIILDDLKQIVARDRRNNHVTINRTIGGGVLSYTFDRLTMVYAFTCESND